MTIKKLSKKFGKKIIFDSFFLDIGDSGIYALKGESGCGKTTLLRMISGLDKKYSGNIDLENIKRISYVFQEPRLLEHSTALENVMLVIPKDENQREKAVYWLKKLGLENEINAYPDELSGGMKQRVAIARAFCYDGDILLLDEAFNGIDEERVKSIADIILEFAKNKPVIIVSHNKEHLDMLNARVIEL